MAILVTGGTGFVGSTVALEILKHRNEHIVLFDIRPLSQSLSERQKHYIDVIVGDIRDPDFLLKTCKAFNVDQIIHMAAIVDVDVAEKNPRQAYDVNVTGTFNICELTRKLDVRKTIFISSGAVYGKQQGPIPETAEYRAGDVYSATKIMGETLGLQYVQSYGINLFINRYHFVYGPQMFFEPINPLSLVKNAVEQKPSVFTRGGDQPWDFTYVTDAAYGTTLTLFADQTHHRIFNISSGQAFTLYQVADIVKQQIPTACIGIEPGDAGIPRGAPLDLSRANKELGYKPQVSLEEGIKRLIMWLRESK